MERDRNWWDWYIGSLLLFLLVIILMTGCATTGALSIGEPGQRCPEVTIENRSSEPINDGDRATAKIASTRCVKYYPYSPCLITFTKTAPQAYRAICGVER